MGILYSRSIGVLYAKGIYIFSLDNDDMFLNRDIFTTITNISKEGNFDIVEFKGILSNNNKNLLKSKIRDILHSSNFVYTKLYFSNRKLNLVMFQPELGDYPIRAGKKNREYYLFSVYLWSKCIKRNNIYKST